MDGGKCELIVVFQRFDLSVCKKMILCRRTSGPDQVVSCRHGHSYVTLYEPYRRSN